MIRKNKNQRLLSSFTINKWIKIVPVPEMRKMGKDRFVVQV